MSARATLLSQTLPSCIPAPPTCTLSLYLATFDAGPSDGNVFIASVGSVTVLDSTVDPTLINDTQRATYVQHTATFTYSLGAVPPVHPLLMAKTLSHG